MNLDGITQTLEARWLLLVDPCVWLLFAVAAGLFVDRWRGAPPKIVFAGALFVLAAEIVGLMDVIGPATLWMVSRLGLGLIAFGLLMLSLGLPRPERAGK